jgi:UPF0716 protein FxsA
LLPFLLLAILSLPLIEIAVLIYVGSNVGVFPTIGLIILTGFLGMLLLRIQGFAVLSRIRADMDQGKLPDKSLADAAMIALAGIFLIIPGFVSDIIGIMLFLPPVRAVIRSGIGRRATIVRSGSGVGPDVVDLDRADYQQTDSDAGPNSESPSPWRLPLDKR